MYVVRAIQKRRRKASHKVVNAAAALALKELGTIASVMTSNPTVLLWHQKLS